MLEACRLCDLGVPGDIAVLGVDNDEVFCELADPPLSSVALNAEKGGYRAAELLDKMMKGGSRIQRHVIVEALGVVARRSTDIIAVEDEDVATALQFIRRMQGCGALPELGGERSCCLVPQFGAAFSRNNWSHDPGRDPVCSSGASQTTAVRNKILNFEGRAAGRLRLDWILRAILPLTGRQNAAQVPR